jgi:hypothetical protein
MKTFREKVIYPTLDAERDYQDLKWGEAGSKKSIENYLVYIQSYLNDATKAITHAETEQAHHALRKLVALGIACFEDNGILPRS